MSEEEEEEEVDDEEEMEEEVEEEEEEDEEEKVDEKELLKGIQRAIKNACTEESRLTLQLQERGYLGELPSHDTAHKLFFDTAHKLFFDITNGAFHQFCRLRAEYSIKWYNMELEHAYRSNEFLINLLSSLCMCAYCNGTIMPNTWRYTDIC